MNRLAARVAGFAIPTLTLITVLHLKDQMSWGEALDGLVSGALFTLPFTTFGWLRSRLHGHRKSALARGAGHEFALGVVASIVAWAVLWAGWTIPSTTPWRPSAFWINSLVMAVTGLVLPPAGRVRREPATPEASAHLRPYGATGPRS
jgi:hypothetical protein